MQDITYSLCNNYLEKREFDKYKRIKNKFYAIKFAKMLKPGTAIEKKGETIENLLSKILVKRVCEEDYEYLMDFTFSHKASPHKQIIIDTVVWCKNYGYFFVIPFSSPHLAIPPLPYSHSSLLHQYFSLLLYVFPTPYSSFPSDFSSSSFLLKAIN